MLLSEMSCYLLGPGCQVGQQKTAPMFIGAVVFAVECAYILCVWGLTKQQSMAFLPEPHGQGSPRPQHSTYCLPEPHGQAALSFSYMVCSIDGLMVGID